MSENPIKVLVVDDHFMVRLGLIGAIGAEADGKRSSLPSSVSPRASPNATVLPDPVWAETSRSQPAALGSSTASWTAVAVS